MKNSFEHAKVWTRHKSPKDCQLYDTTLSLREFKLSLLNSIENDKTLWLNYSKRHAFQVTTFVFAVQYF